MVVSSVTPRISLPTLLYQPGEAFSLALMALKSEISSSLPGFDTSPIYRYLWSVLGGQTIVFLMMNADLIFSARLLGQEDLAEADVATIKAAGARLGISTHTEEELEIALAAEPDYIAIADEAGECV